MNKDDSISAEPSPDANENDGKGEGVDVSQQSDEAQDVVENPTSDHSASENDAERVAVLEKEVEQLKDKALRSKADLLNYQKRSRRDVEDARQFAIQEFARALLEVVDNFQRALTAARANNDFDNLATGVEMTSQQLLTTLRNHGVTPVEAEGQPFDPNVHEAVMQEERDDVEPGTVIEELVRGYVIGERLLRPSVVRVSKAKEQGQDDSDGEA